MIGWLLDTNVTAEIIGASGSALVKAWAAQQDEATHYLSILTIAEYDKGVANLHEHDPPRALHDDARQPRYPVRRAIAAGIRPDRAALAASSAGP